jgi:hypothetical protein
MSISTSSGVLRRKTKKILLLFVPDSAAMNSPVQIAGLFLHLILGFDLFCADPSKPLRWAPLYTSDFRRKFCVSNIFLQDNPALV